VQRAQEIGGERHENGFARTKEERSMARPYGKGGLESRISQSFRSLKIRMVADAVGIKPVSTAGFPANREKSSEFCDFGPISGESSREGQ